MEVNETRDLIVLARSIRPKGATKITLKLYGVSATARWSGLVRRRGSLGTLFVLAILPRAQCINPSAMVCQLNFLKDYFALHVASRAVAKLPPDPVSSVRSELYSKNSCSYFLLHDTPFLCLC